MLSSCGFREPQINAYKPSSKASLTKPASLPVSVAYWNTWSWLRKLLTKQLLKMFRNSATWAGRKHKLLRQCSSLQCSLFSIASLMPLAFHPKSTSRAEN